MRKAAGLLILLGVAAGAASAQTFEVASVKASPPERIGSSFVGRTGGPGTHDPTRVRFANFSLAGLIMNAYDISYFQLSGPAWINDARFEVTATLAADTTKEQFCVMLQNLLAERFKLAIHRDRKSMSVYALTIAPGGPKFHESPAEARAAADDGKQGAAGPVTRDKDGYPALPPGARGAMISGPNGVIYARVRASGDDAMSYLASQISGQLAAPVEDDTHLTGRYDFTLSWIAQTPQSLDPNGAQAGPNLITAVQEQLGLKLTARKGEVDTIVVDHAEKQPAEN